MDTSLTPALMRAFAQELRALYPLLATPLAVKLRLEQLRLAELVRGAGRFSKSFLREKNSIEAKDYPPPTSPYSEGNVII